MSLPSVNILHLTKSKKEPGQYFLTHGQCPDKILRSLQQDQKSNQGHTMTLHTYNPLPSIPYSFEDTARTRLSSSRTLQQGQKSNQGHTMTLHTYKPQPMYLPSINFLHLMDSEI